MTKLYNVNHLKKRRKALRNNSTRAEQCLWHRLRSKQLLGLRFRRQYSIGPYIADFYLPSYRLVIEIDGPSHFAPGKKLEDIRRTAFLKSCRMNVLRFRNDEIYLNIEGVLQAIAEYIGVCEE